MIKVIPKHLLDGGGGFHKGEPYEIERETMRLISVIHDGKGYVAICERLGEVTYAVQDEYLRSKKVVEKVGDIVPRRLETLRVLHGKETEFEKSEQIAYLKEMIMFMFGEAIEKSK